MTRISFLVPTFNRAEYLGEALSAIVAQLGEADDVLVIDDGSTDATAGVVASFAPRVRYLRQDNAGKSAALNRGLAESQGEFVWICDDDDELRPGAVDLLADALTDSDAGWAFARYSRFRDHEDGRRVDLGTGYWPDLSHAAPVRHILEDGFVMQNAALVRRSLYRAVGPFSSALPRSIDYEMFVRLALAAPCVALDAVVFDQRKHDGVRGPASDRHAVERSDDVWRGHDQAIFEHMHRHVPLSFFTALFEGPEPMQQRAGLLQRGVIMARHDSPRAALEDFAAAAESAPGIPLDSAELRICGRALAGKNAFAGLPGDELAKGLRELARSGAHASQIVEAMIAGARWRLRRGTWTQRFAALRESVIAGGLARTLRAAMAGAPAAADKLHERATLARGVYLAPGTLPVFA